MTDRMCGISTAASVEANGKLYRRNVAGVLVNDAGLILACHRSDVEGAWQLPQGGVEPGESDQEALERELMEEIGASNCEIIGSLDEMVYYDWPKELWTNGWIGQAQMQFLVKLPSGNSIDLSLATADEFDRVEWIHASDFFTRLCDFKKNAYITGINRLMSLFPGHIKG